MKNCLFVDGTNLYASQYELFGPQKYLIFSKFIKEVEKKIKVKFNKIYFYASYSPKPKRLSKKQKLYLKNEGLFYKSVKETKNLFFFKGYRSETSGKEKEVDVKLTADLVTFAFLKRYEKVFLFTGDADFLQALFNIKRFSFINKIFLLCLQNRIMYKGAFHFKTYVLVFNSLKNDFHKKQKVELTKIKVEKVTKSFGS